MRLTHRLLCILAACAVSLLPAPLRAHEFKLDAIINAFVTTDRDAAHLVVRVPLYLFKAVRFPIKEAEIDIPKAQPALERALAAIQKDLVIFENGRPLKATHTIARLSLPSDRSFDGYDDALRHVSAPIEPDTRIYVDQGYVDAHLTYPLESAHPELAIQSTAGPELGDALRLSVRYTPLAGEPRTLIVRGQTGIVALNPTPWRAAATFVGLGMEHILTGFDHLLFLLCLIIPLRRWQQVLAIVTTFTVAHSLTLIGSAFHLTPNGNWFPPFVETAIAASIVYMALENIMRAEFARRMLITGMFGLIHGFGFSYGLQESLQFAGTHLIVSLFAFNLGIEAGQLLVLAVMIPALVLVRRYVLPGRVGMIILSSMAALTAWQWMLERGNVLLNAPWPRPTLADLASVLLWVAGLLAAAGVLRLAARKLEPAPHPLPLSRQGAAD